MTGPIIAQSLAGAAQGGAENFFYRLTASLAAQGCQQQVFSRLYPHRQQQLNQAGITGHHFRFGGRLDLWDRFRYQKRLKQLQPDLVMTWMNRASDYTANGNYKLIARLGHYYNLKYYRHCDYWLGITKGLCDYLINNGCPAERVFHVPNFADESPKPAIDATSLPGYGQGPLLLAAGRLHRNKGFDTLLQALVKLPEAQLLLAGTGPELASLQALSQELNIAGRVHFLGWRQDVAALMQACDLFVCPSRHEGFGSIVVEAWFNQCPIVATASQGPGELIENGRTGLLCPIDQPQALASAIAQALAQPELSQSLASQALQHYQAHYSQARVTLAYQQLFDLLHARSKPGK